ncbi:MAG: LysM domain-containing protein [Nocardioides sp.]|uniref:LysM peptidoglycan-binding domain-containing protein n=1 Tax=Nocardioides sp. TaxID=35761 RepID=UPI0039E22F5B
MSAGPEKVFPADPASSSSSGGSGGSGALAGTIGVGKLRIRKRTAAIAGAAVAVVAGLIAANRNPADDTEEADGEGSTAILDTTDTDVYNDLQGAIEQLTDELGDRPRPPKPGGGNGGKKHRGNKPGPRGGSGTKGNTYRVGKGDKLSVIAKKFKISPVRLYHHNRKVIEAAARAHGRKSSQAGRYLYAGTVLEIPKKK